jgi:predicted ABC-type ATPase
MAADEDKGLSKTYTIIAGINGAGKTSLYNVLLGQSASGALGVRVNADEILTEAGGDWRDTMAQLSAGREALNRINTCIDTGVSFHQETTLPGPTILKYVKKAKAVGFEIYLYFVGVDSLQIALDRVHRRVQKGGHGIEDHVIAKRYRALPKNLSEVLPLCDMAVFYDNTTRFRQFAIIKDGRLVDFDREVPGWFFAIKGIPLALNPSLPEYERPHIEQATLRFIPAGVQK